MGVEQRGGLEPASGGVGEQPGVVIPLLTFACPDVVGLVLARTGRFCP